MKNEKSNHALTIGDKQVVNDATFGGTWNVESDKPVGCARYVANRLAIAFDKGDTIKTVTEKAIAKNVSKDKVKELRNAYDIAFAGVSIASGQAMSLVAALPNVRKSFKRTFTKERTDKKGIIHSPKFTGWKFTAKLVTPAKGAKSVKGKLAQMIALAKANGLELPLGIEESAVAVKMDRGASTEKE